MRRRYRWLEGSQWQVLTYLGKTWGKRDTRYAEDQGRVGRRGDGQQGCATPDLGRTRIPKPARSGPVRRGAQLRQLKAIVAAARSEPRRRARDYKDAARAGRVFVFLGRTSQPLRSRLAGTAEHVGHVRRIHRLVSRLTARAVGRRSAAPPGSFDHRPGGAEGRREQVALPKSALQRPRPVAVLAMMQTAQKALVREAGRQIEHTAALSVIRRQKSPARRGQERGGADAEKTAVYVRR